MDVVLPDVVVGAGDLLVPPESRNEIEKIFASFFMNFKSAGTIEAYKQAAKEMFKFLGDEVKGPEDLRRHYAIAYKKSLETRGLANKTILKKLSGISSLCKFLAEAGLMDRDVTYGVSRPRSENRRETAAIEDADVTKVIQSVKPWRLCFGFA